jgi:Flp pilus assembly protein TadG
MGVSRAGSSRRGTTSVEVAFVLPVFLVFVFAIIQIGHVTMVENLLQSACRQAARLGATENVDTADTEAEALQIIGSGIPVESVNLIVRDASVYDTTEAKPVTSEDFQALDPIELAEAESRQMFLVRAEVMYNDVALLSLPWMQDVRVVGHCITRHE